MSDRMVLTPIPNFSKLADKLITKRDLEDFALTAVIDIQKRTQLQNVDYQGRAFKPYSKKYAEWKGQTRVTLTGKEAGTRMLNSMKVKANEKESIIYYNDKEKEDIARKNMKTRKFFEFSKKQEKDINKEYKKLMEQRIKDWENDR